MAGLVIAAAPVFAASCESLSMLSFPDAVVNAAQTVGAGEMRAPVNGKGKAGANPFASLPAFCRVQMTVKPTADSDIRVEIWLPVANWNKKFEANGNGGWSGSISPATLAGGLQRGYTTAMTDTGHEGGSASFAMGHPEKLIDFGYRSVHEMATKGKAVVKAFYGEDAKYSYWNGCSAGGRQGLMEAQRYPGDFDAIVAGSPGLNWTGRSMQAIWVAQGTHKDEASSLPRTKFAAIHAAALEACDALDGIKDGVIDDPTRCHFDPKVMECKGADEPTCLTSAQVESVRRIYSDVINVRTKQEVFPAHEPGSEMGWNTMAGPNVFGLGADMFKFVVFKDPDWDYKSFNFDSDIDATLKEAGDLNAMNPNIKPFIDRGGKMIQYHGWADPQISPRSSVEYYKAVLDTQGGASKVMGSYRLFMEPGMAHCGGGDGPNTFDMLTALEQWKEQGKAPDQIIASHSTGGKVDRTRPLCPYPQVAKYKGTGSTDEAANFACVAP
jgi:feruloyl esterase